MDQRRRQSAIELARQINSAQSRTFGRVGRYVPMTQLPSLPSVPTGFRLRHHTDGDSYMFSLKDETDICKYGLFSDQDGILYEKSPLPVQLASRVINSNAPILVSRRVR